MNKKILNPRMDSHVYDLVSGSKVFCSLLIVCLGLAYGSVQAHADTFGSGANAFTIDFVNIGNAGNAGKAVWAGTHGGVAYTYRMGVYEISQDQIDKATAAGLTNVTAGKWTGSQPASNMTWYEAAAFVNWLNTSTGHQAAYNLTYSGSGWTMTLWESADAWQAGGENRFRHKNAYYFLPSENEWYKAGYHKNDGVTGNYWAYATGSDTAPTAVASGTGEGTAVYDGVTSSPAAVNNAGGLSPYGTMGQNGNVWEWTESNWHIPNDDAGNVNRAVHGGPYSLGAGFLGWDGSDSPANEPSDFGFRVASVVVPAISTSGSFSAISSIYGTATASSSTVTVSGSNLTANITATAPAGFQVSSDGSTWGSTATFTQSSGSASGTLRVRVAAATAAGTYSGNVALASTGATSVNVAVPSSTVTNRGDTFGSGANAFTIDFANIGNAGNAGEAALSGTYGGVAYAYRMGVYEISQDQIDKATAGGLANVTAGAWTGSQPASNMTWYEAAAFVNWLNTSTGHQAAYNLTYSGSGWTMTLWDSADAWQAGGENRFRHKDAYYFLPSENEWYKAAYHKNDGVTANYWDYATGSDTAPTAVASGTGAGTAVYNGVTSSPAAVDTAGGLSPYGTMGQNGNVWEWTESNWHTPNYNAGNVDRSVLGGVYNLGAGFLPWDGSGSPANGPSDFGFRVASVVVPLPAITWSNGVIVNSNGVGSFSYSYSGRSANGVNTSYSSASAPSAAGYYTVVATSTDENYSGSSTNNYFVAGLVAVNDALTKPLDNQPFIIELATLLANDKRITSEGTVATDGLSIIAATGGTGNTATLNGDILFTPSNGSPESFTYTLSYGAQTATGTVTVTREAAAPSFTLQIVRVGTAVYSAPNTTVTHDFIGVPGQSYAVEYSTDLTNWTSAGNQSTGATGSFSLNIIKSGNFAADWNTHMFFRARLAP